MSTENPRFTITVTENMLKEIDDFRYKNRYPTRTKAVNELFRIGLEVIHKQMKEEAEKNSDSNEKTV